ncbi:MAG: phenylalanine--tRNA ligase subunit beta [Candidatus Nanohaloarchaeota archaeon]|nr:phenylalanine--tRNA ligase subunit beta [Candidatus Nanohaloarchaeota archaeon]
MPTVLLNINRINKLIGKALSKDGLEQALTSIGTAVEKIEGEELELEVFPNRPDLLSEEGVARALRYYLGVQKHLITYDIKKGKEEVFTEKEALTLRPHIRMFIAKNVKEFSFEGLIQLQEKLHVTHGRRRKAVSIGVHDASAVSFPVYYKAVDSSFKFIPLGWEKEASIKEILEKHDKGIKYGHLLTGTSYPLWIDAENKVLALPPIINGIYTAVSPKTKDFVVDVTGMDEKKVDEIAKILASHFYELTPEIYDVKINGNYYLDMSYRKKKVSGKEIQDYLGINIDVKKALFKMGVGYENETALIPPYRTDILHPIDIIEDVAIGYGYDNFEAVIPQIPGVGEEHTSNILERTIKAVFVGLNAIEVKNYHLSNEEIMFSKLNLTPQTIIEVENPMNQEYYMLRTHLTPQLLENLSHNKLYEYPQFIFEIGSVFEKLKEKRHLAFAYIGKDAGFSKAKGIMERLLKELGIKAEFLPHSSPFLLEGRSASIKSKILEGYFGEVHPSVLNNFELELPTIIGEFRIK